MIGTVKSINIDRGFGFITAGKQDYFFHHSALKNVKLKDLDVGEEVTFEDAETTRGFRAEDIFV